jgi:hypothetical protein
VPKPTLVITPTTDCHDPIRKKKQSAITQPVVTPIIAASAMASR